MRGILLCAAILVGGAACAPAPAPLAGDALVERGAYLVNQVAGCGDCHTAMTPAGPDMAHALQGSTLPFAPTVDMPWVGEAPAIAGIPGHYTHEQFVAFLETGARPDGSLPLPPMPAYRFNEADAEAVTAYIASLPRAE
jgi:cytochrome c553